MDTLIYLLYEFGNYAPIFLIFLSIYLLWDKQNLIFYYIIGLFLNSILNLILKGLTQQPRPFEDKTKFDLAITRGKRFLFKDGIPFNTFGMPSGHAQSSIYSTIFVYLALRKNNLFYIYFITSLISMIERILYSFHSTLQIVVGAVIGGGFGYLTYLMATNKMKGIITEKWDDFGPI